MDLLEVGIQLVMLGALYAIFGMLIWVTPDEETLRCQVRWEFIICLASVGVVVTILGMIVPIWWPMPFLVGLGWLGRMLFEMRVMLVEQFRGEKVKE